MADKINAVGPLEAASNTGLIDYVRDLALRALESPSEPQVGDPEPSSRVQDGPARSEPESPPTQVNAADSAAHGNPGMSGLPALGGDLRELAKRAVEAQRNDTRTQKQIVADGVKFIMGPGGDEGTRQVPGGVPSNAELDALVERLNTFEQSDDLGDGDFSLCVEAASALVALRAMQEIEQPYRTYTYWKDRAEAAERDAARYRWLRSASVTNGAIDPDDDDFWNDLGDLLDEKFDAAIDAAMKAKP